MARTTFSVLAVDGGGIRGIIPARLLQAIEEELHRPVAELFDLAAGTSTGGIIALGLATPGPGGRPELSAEDLLGLYTEHGHEIFDASLWRRIGTLGGLRDARYSEGPLERLLQERFGTAMLSQALLEVVVPAYDLSLPGPFFFKRRYARDEQHTWDVEHWRAARATSAAPTYFEPAELPPFENEGAHALIDGGVFANNPAACAYAEALPAFTGEAGGDVEIHVVSVGTGEPPPRPGTAGGPVPYDRARGWGLAHWAGPMLHVVFDGVSKTVDYQMRRLCADAEDTAPRYHRVQSDLPTASPALDDGSPRNIGRLIADAEALVDKEAQLIAEVCADLRRIAVQRDAGPRDPPA